MPVQIQYQAWFNIILLTKSLKTDSSLYTLGLTCNLLQISELFFSVVSMKLHSKQEICHYFLLQVSGHYIQQMDQRMLNTMNVLKQQHSRDNGQKLKTTKITSYLT